MRRSLFSPLWYRFSGQRPRLHLDVRVERQSYRGELWFLLVDPASGRHFRINDKAYQFVGRCDGNHTVQEVWDTLLETRRDEAPTQDEVIALLGKLDEQGLMVTDAVPDADALIDRAQRARRQRRKGFVNPFAFRVSLGDPWPVLRHLARPSEMVFQPITFCIWLATVMTGCLVAAANWDALRAHADTYLGTATYLFLTWLSFPVIKGLHELCHALAVRRWGGEVHEVGITLFLLVPAPYVDASASTGFRRRRQRLLVCAAGVMCEVFIAAMALFVWLAVEPGTIRNLAFVSMVTASVSTLLFNGNPLLKFDAYHVLCEMLDLPNLAMRSSRWWGEQVRRVVLGETPEVRAPLAAGERKWLALYAPLSGAYRLLINGVIILWVGAKSAPAGMAAAAFFVATVLVKPLVAASRRLLESAGPGRARWRVRGALAAGSVALAALAFLVPLPLRTAALGVVWLPEQARVSAQTDGFVAEVLARDGEPVRAGDVILRLEDPVLLASRERLAQRLGELETERVRAITKSEFARAQNFDEDISRTESELGRVEDDIEHLAVRCGADGVLVMPRQQDLPGSYVRQGVRLGVVLDRQDIVVRAAVREADAALVRERTLRVGVRIAGDAGEEMDAELVREVPAAARELPSPALGDRGGGPYAIDPTDKEGVRSLEPVVLVDLKLPATTLERVGSRAWVRFDHGHEALAGQVYRRARQLLLRHFDPSGV